MDLLDTRGPSQSGAGSISTGKDAGLGGGGSARASQPCSSRGPADCSRDLREKEEDDLDARGVGAWWADLLSPRRNLDLVLLDPQPILDSFSFNEVCFWLKCSYHQLAIRRVLAVRRNAQFNVFGHTGADRCIHATAKYALLMLRNVMTFF